MAFSPLKIDPTPRLFSVAPRRRPSPAVIGIHRECREEGKLSKYARIPSWQSVG